MNKLEKAITLAIKSICIWVLFNYATTQAAHRSKRDRYSPKRSTLMTLLTSDVPRDDRGNTALHIAARRKNLFAAQMLLSSAADVHATNNNGDTPLHLACGMSIENTAIVQLFIDNHGSVNACNKKGCTPLHVASASGHTATAELLLSCKAAADIADYDNQTPLFYAIACKEPALLRILMRAESAHSDLSLATAVLATTQPELQ